MLNAHVNCDCFEKGRVKSDPPHRELLYVGDDGFVEARSNDFAIQAKSTIGARMPASTNAGYSSCIASGI